MPHTNLSLSSVGAGIGDIIAASWIVEGINRAGGHASFAPGGHEPLIRMLGQPIEPSEYGIPLGGAHAGMFRAELRNDGKPVPRVVLWQRWLPVNVKPARPGVAIDDEDSAWAEKYRARVCGGRPLLLIFPGCHATIRKWALHKFLRVAECLTRYGWRVVVLDAHEDMVKHWKPRLHNPPLGRMAALMRVADAVLTNDTGPAHLAGTIGTKTFAVLGPTDAVSVFGHCPEVEGLSVSPKVLGCVGCRYQAGRGYQGACGLGCEALSLLTSDEVARRVDEWNRLGRGA